MHRKSFKIEIKGMPHLIDKDALVAEIKRRLNLYDPIVGYEEGRKDEAKSILSFLDTLEVKEADTWHLQEKEDIYGAVKDWGLYTFACIMKDGTIQKFIGSMDEDCEGHINVHIYGVNDDYDDVDDIVKWIECA